MAKGARKDAKKGIYILILMAYKGKFGRNDPCWCGSGKKYKKCHLNRSSEPPVPYHQLATDLRGLRAGDKLCLHPPNPSPCKNRTIRAHSISRNAALAKIARAGKVYQPNSDPFEIAKGYGKIRHSLVGINSATTFTGFCGTHDNALFKPIDEGNLLLTKEQALLLHYRALCRELYVKRPTLLTNELLKDLDRGKSEYVQQHLHGLVAARSIAIGDAIERMEVDKAACDRAILTGYYEEISGSVFSFRRMPTLACSGLTQPIYDFAAKILQKINDMNKPLLNLSFTLLPNDSGGIAAFVWLRHAESVCRPFVSSLLAVPDNRKSDALVQLVFDSFENHAAQPDWWENLSIEAKSDLGERMLNWTDIRPINNRALVVGDQRFADWGFESASWIGVP
ncbi:MAG TPA: SEC-C domain-containing protein [Terriglobales bacterium]